MTWLDDVIAVYGKPRVAAPKEGVKRTTPDGPCIKRGWVWFPGNRNHCVSIDHYEPTSTLPGRYVVSVTSHVTGKADVELRSTQEPDDTTMRNLLGLADFTGEPTHRTGYPKGSTLTVSTTWAGES